MTIKGPKKMSGKRPPVKIKFKFNLETGNIEEFIIDDNAAGASEEYHDRVAEKIGELLARNPEIFDAGPRRQAETLAKRLNEKEKPKSNTIKS